MRNRSNERKENAVMTPNNRPELAAQSPLLQQWLRTATRWLSPEAAERVQREIIEHFDATVLVQLEQAKSLAAAEQHALNALGSPWRAFWQLRKSNLTYFEAQTISVLTGTPDNVTKNPWGYTVFGWVVSIYYLVIAASSSQDRFSSSSEDINGWCCSFATIAILAPHTIGPLLFRLAPRLGARAVLRRVWWIQCWIAVSVAVLPMTTMDAFPQALSTGEFDTVVFFVYFGCVLFMSILTARLIRKLHVHCGPVQS